MTKCREHYEALAHHCKEVVILTFDEDSDGRHAANHLFIDDAEKWCSVLTSFPEVTLLQLATKHFQFSLLSASQGKYREAFYDLRSFLEQALAAIWFSGHTVEYHMWARGQRDIFWSELVDPDIGVFSTKYIMAFFPDFLNESKHYNSIAKKVYRECSEYVHGNQQLDPVLKDEINFDKDIFLAYHDKVETAILVVTFCLVMRYLKHVPKYSQLVLENSVLDRLGFLSVVREVYEAKGAEV